MYQLNFDLPIVVVVLLMIRLNWSLHLYGNKHPFLLSPPSPQEQKMIPRRYCCYFSLTNSSRLNCLLLSTSTQYFSFTFTRFLKLKSGSQFSQYSINLIRNLCYNLLSLMLFVFGFRSLFITVWYPSLY